MIKKSTRDVYCICYFIYNFSLQNYGKPGHTRPSSQTLPPVLALGNKELEKYLKYPGLVEYLKYPGIVEYLKYLGLAQYLKYLGLVEYLKYLGQKELYSI